MSFLVNRLVVLTGYVIGCILKMTKYVHIHIKCLCICTSPANQLKQLAKKTTNAKDGDPFDRHKIADIIG